MLTYPPPNAVIKDAFDSKQNKNQKLTSKDTDLLVKQTLLSTCEVEMRVNHLSNIKRHRHEVALKSSAKIKETSVDKSNRKSASLDTDESWCICG